MRFESLTHLHFKPNTEFYKLLGINQFRFSKLVNGQKRPDSEEIKGLVDYFNRFFPV